MNYSPIQTTMIVRFGTHFNIRLGEWFLAILLTSLAYLFLASPLMFERSEIYFMGLSRIATQFSWGLAMLFVGAVRIIALWVNGRKRITPYIRMALAFLSCFIWFQLSISFLASGQPGIAWAIIPWLMFLDMYNVFRSSADAREVFDKKRAERNGAEGLS